jgi:hypothetical protein
MYFKRIQIENSIRLKHALLIKNYKYYIFQFVRVHVYYDRQT